MNCLLVVVTATLASLCPAHSLEYCVVPDVGKDCDDCPLPLDNALCNTVQYFAATLLFTSNATFHFLEGEHVLDLIVAVTDVANISLIGVGPHQNSSKVLCGSTSAGFFIQNFDNFSVINLSFHNCGVDLPGYDGTLVLLNGSGLNIDHVTIFNSSGYGLSAYDSRNHTSISNSIFTDNQAYGSPNGGNVFIAYLSCNGLSKLSINQCEFLKGHAGYESRLAAGLSVLINCTDVQVVIMNSVLHGNRGYDSANLFVAFGSLAGNFIQISNVTISNGKSSSGPGMGILLDRNLPLYDPISCGGSSSHLPQHLMEFSFNELYKITILKNNGICSLLFDDSMKPGADCSAQYVLMKDSVISENWSPAGDWMLEQGTVVCFNPSGPFKTIQATFDNVSISANTAAQNQWPPSSSIFFLMVLNVTFIDCRFENNQMTAIMAISSKLVFQGENIFRNNSAVNGAGLLLLQNSYMSLNQHSHITFIDNYASNIGGAIYVENSVLLPPYFCFFQVDYGNDVRIDFFNNTAGTAGSSLYMPPVYWCMTRDWRAMGENTFERVFKVRNTEIDPSAIASAPSGVCVCAPGSAAPGCDDGNHSISSYPGEAFPLRLAVVGTMDGTVPGTIHAKFSTSSPQARLGPLQDTQMNWHANCSEFTYTVFSTLSSLHINLGPSSDGPFLTVNLELKDCPMGFTLKHDTWACVCHPTIRRDNIHCFINNQSILRPADSWIGFQDSNTSNETGVIFSEHCPYGYCLSHDVYLRGDDPDIQCVGNRTGVLCGKCAESYSLTLGTDQQCSRCSDIFLLILLPLVASGLVLVAVLFVLNLTVAKGDINGLIFYANVVSMSHSMQDSKASGHLYTFIAWLNLDLGISTCFYDGMDAYAETWLQFLFPLYLWGIIIAIIVFFKFPKLVRKVKLSRRSMQSPVKVLATLLLLSYTKLQRILVTIFSFTTLKYPSGDVHYVWLYDANLDFLKGKHLYLFIAGVLVLLFLILPYTLGLAFFQHLQACSGRRACRWVNPLKPVFDSYSGPYKDRYRAWTGLLLVVRSMLIILFSFNITGSLVFNHFVILVMSLSLLMLSTGGVYAKWQHSALDAFFHVQLGVFSGGTIYISLINGNSSALADFSFGTALFIFLAILGHHLFSFFRGVCCRKGYDAVNPEEEEELLFHNRERVLPAVALTQSP